MLDRTILQPLRGYLEQLGGEVRLGKPVTEVRPIAGGWQTVVGNELIESEDVIFALPAHQRLSFLPEPPPHPYSPIVCSRFEIDQYPGLDWVGLAEETIDWVFFTPGTAPLMETVTSGNRGWSARSHDEILDRTIAIIAHRFPKIRITRKIGVVKEAWATPLQTPEWDAARLSPATGVAGLWRAGDDLATGLPATIESASRAGVWAAQLVIEKTSKAIPGICPTHFVS